MVDENLRFAYPQLSEAQRRNLSWRMWEHLVLFLTEVAHAPRKIHETNWRDYVELRDSDRLVRIALSERASMVVSAHFGNFELGGVLLGILGFPTHTVARTLDNPYLDAYVNRFRGTTGQKMIPKQGGYEEILRVLAGGGMMAFLADQYAGTKGCWITFFGRPASAHKAIALLALDNNAYMMIGSTRRLDRPLHFELATHGIIDPTQFGGGSGQCQTVHAVVHQRIGAGHSDGSRAVLVATPPLEGSSVARTPAAHRCVVVCHAIVFGLGAMPRAAVGMHSGGKHGHASVAYGTQNRPASISHQARAIRE